MRIRRFLESKNNLNSLLDDYFSDLAGGGDINDQVYFDIKEVNNNLSEVKIKIKKIPFSSSEGILAELEHISNKTKTKLNITKYIRSSVIGLLNDDNVEDIKWRFDEDNFTIRVWSKIKDGDEDWIFEDDDDLREVSIDELRLKKLMKSKFNLEFVSVDISEYMEEEDERLISFNVDYKNIEDIDKFIDYLCSIELFGHKIITAFGDSLPVGNHTWSTRSSRSPKTNSTAHFYLIINLYPH